MNKLILAFLFITLSLFIQAQTIHNLHNKWAFSGSRTTFFTVKNDTLFFSMIHDHDIDQYEPFYNGKPDIEKLTLFPCKVTQFQDKLMITTEVSDSRRTGIFTFIYSTSDSTNLIYIGDVYTKDKGVAPQTNSNCDLEIPNCSSRLYAVDDFEKIRSLKSIKEISKEEVLEVFEQHAEICKTKCNQCAEGFPGAEINQILIKMGYNPIITEDWNDSYAYRVSGFDNFMDIYEEDEEVFNAFKAYFLAFRQNTSEDDQ